jgi:hypothetical protein
VIGVNKITLKIRRCIISLVVPNVGEVTLLQYMLSFGATNGDKVLRLFNSDHTPSETSTVSGGSIVQATEAGYAPITLASSSWTTSQDGAGVTTGLYSAQTFTFTTGANIYGYYVTDNTLTGLLWAERFSGAPFALPTGGGTIQISARIQLS